MRISWVIESRGAAQADVPTVDAAAKALSAGVRQAYAREDATTLAHIMFSVVGPLRTALVTDGHRAVKQGETWEAREGAILVQLSPN
ncbi:hypothetical protein [Streptomyces sp. DHE17-7]|uniref:hypothetical protein n=1 Tax=Streptomyces sp. DHE17-7 TaxID=2759949 RepID=UPI0022EA368D|nr:hypothetical protein [Streptomyces sp. DHE17-7]MBJ6623604.1 hypothetical protein [Streptomyces sp. DHE17-7]